MEGQKPAYLNKLKSPTGLL